MRLLAADTSASVTEPARHSGGDITAAELDILDYFLGLALASTRGRDQLTALLYRRGYRLLPKSNYPRSLDTVAREE